METEEIKKLVDDGRARGGFIIIPEPLTPELEKKLRDEFARQQNEMTMMIPDEPQKVTTEQMSNIDLTAKLRAKLDAEANALGVVGMRHTGDAPLPLETIAQDLGTIADWNARAAEPAVRVTHGWLWGYFEPIGTAFKAREWKRAIGQFAMRVLPLVIVLLIALNALKGCMGLNN